MMSQGLRLAQSIHAELSARLHKERVQVLLSHKQRQFRHFYIQDDFLTGWQV